VVTVSTSHLNDTAQACGCRFVAFAFRAQSVQSRPPLPQLSCGPQRARGEPGMDSLRESFARYTTANRQAIILRRPRNCFLVGILPRREPRRI
jgi:hypothetical protein